MFFCRKRLDFKIFQILRKTLRVLPYVFLKQYMKLGFHFKSQISFLGNSDKTWYSMAVFFFPWKSKVPVKPLFGHFCHFFTDGNSFSRMDFTIFSRAVQNFHGHFLRFFSRLDFFFSRKEKRKISSILTKEIIFFTYSLFFFTYVI